MSFSSKKNLKKESFSKSSDQLPIRESGQALLIVLLAMVVVATIVLSVLAGSITDIKITTHEEEASRAFSAAEAGVEKALIAGSASSGTVGNSSYTANVSSFSQTGTDFILPSDLASGDVGTVWFVSHASDESLICNSTNPCFTGRTLKICWGRSGTSGSLSTTPAIEGALFYLTTPGNYATTRIARFTYDPNTSRQASNFFSSPDSGTCQIAGTSFSFQKTIDISTLGIPATSYNVQNGLQMLRVKMIYNSNALQPLGIDVNFAGNSTLPSQGARIDSTGTSGESIRRIEVLRTFSDLPPIFDSAFFSSTGITK